MKYKEVLQILDTWIIDYPSLVITVLWRIELRYIQKGKIEASNRIMHLRAKAYRYLIDKYRAEDPEGIGIFEKEYKYCISTCRKLFSPEELAEREAKRKKEKKETEEYYAKRKDVSESLEMERCDRQSYTHISDYIINNLSGVKSLFDVKFSNKKYDVNENRKILDILEAIAYDEEKQALFAENSSFYLFRNHVGYHDDSVKYRGIIGYDGKQHLCPFRTVYGLFYRGQTAYYSRCISSIDRGLSDAQIFVERLKMTAVKYLFKKHPATERYNEGTQYQLLNGKELSFVYHIDFPALAQHYGVYTNLLDLTSDKLVAAFFACTGYNRKEDKYYPYTKKGKGVFYVYRDKNIFSQESKVSCIGMQPLSRPGAQAGFVLAMNENEDFNDCCSESIAFTHDKTEAKKIYKIVEFLIEPFKNDVMGNKVKDIVKWNTFSKDILEETIQLFYTNTPNDVIKRWVAESNIDITDDYFVKFTEQELINLKKEALVTTEELKTKVFNRTIISMKIE